MLFSSPLHTHNTVSGLMTVRQANCPYCNLLVANFGNAVETDTEEKSFKSGQNYLTKVCFHAVLTNKCVQNKRLGIPATFNSKDDFK